MNVDWLIKARDCNQKIKLLQASVAVYLYKLIMMEDLEGGNTKSTSYNFDVDEIEIDDDLPLNHGDLTKFNSFESSEVELPSSIDWCSSDFNDEEIFSLPPNIIPLSFVDETEITVFTSSSRTISSGTKHMFVCEYCGRKYTRKGNLLKHQKVCQQGSKQQHMIPLLNSKTIAS